MPDPLHRESEYRTVMIEPKVALYWDFDNIHLNVPEPSPGARARVNIGAIMDYTAGLGTVVINRAYANWGPYSQYQCALLRHAVDLVQLFPRGQNAKNGADIRLALDALEDGLRHGHISHLVIVGGDSDCIAAAQKLRLLGKTVIGIGVQGSTNRYWAASCNEFRYYHTLLAGEDTPPSDQDAATAALQNSKRVLVQALRKLYTAGGQQGVLLAKIRCAMKWFDPRFDPAHHGFATMGEFIAACADVVRCEPGEHDKIVYLRELEGSAPPRPAAPPADPLEALFATRGEPLSKGMITKLLSQANAPGASTWTYDQVEALVAQAVAEGRLEPRRDGAATAYAWCSSSARSGTEAPCPHE